MYKFNRDRVLESAETLSRRLIGIAECENAVSSAMKKLDGIGNAESAQSELARILKALGEQRERISRLKYVTELAADIYYESDKRALMICTGERKAAEEFAADMLADKEEPVRISLPIDIEIE